MPTQDDLPDRDPLNYVRGAPGAARILGGVHRTQVHHYVRQGRLRSWPASALYGETAGGRPDRLYYIPELKKLRQELEKGWK